MAKAKAKAKVVKTAANPVEPRKTYTAFLHGPHITARTVLQQVLTEYAHILRRDIDAVNSYQRASKVHEHKDVLYIRFFSWPETDRHTEKYPPTHSFGVELRDNHRGYWYPSKSGTKFKDPEGNQVASLVKSTLFIPFNLPESNDFPAVEKIMRGIMNLVSSEFIDAKTFDDRLKAYYAEHDLRAPEVYAELCNERLRRAVLDKTAELDQARKNLQAYQQHYINAMRNQELLEREVDLIKQIKPDNDRFKLEFEKIRALPKVTFATIRGSHILIETDHLKSQKLKDGTVRSLGKFAVDIEVDSGDLRVKNLTHQIDTYHHPHIDQSGIPCFGNIQESMTDLVARYEFAPVIEITLKYLQSINEGDRSGVQVYKWPVEGAKV